MSAGTMRGICFRGCCGPCLSDRKKPQGHRSHGESARSITVSPLSPGNPHAPQPVHSPRSSDSRAPGMKNLRHTSSDSCWRATEVPQDTWYLRQICSDSVGGGVSSRGAESSNPRRAAFGRSRSLGLAMALQPPFLRRKHSADILHILFCLQSLAGWDILRYELFPLNSCTTPGSQKKCARVESRVSSIGS